LKGAVKDFMPVCHTLRNLENTYLVAPYSGLKATGAVQFRSCAAGRIVLQSI
jgi:hypothetical protein